MRRGVSAFESSCANDKVDLPFDIITQLYEVKKRGGGMRGAGLQLKCSIFLVGVQPWSVRVPPHHHRPSAAVPRHGAGPAPAPGSHRRPTPAHARPRLYQTGGGGGVCQHLGTLHRR